MPAGFSSGFDLSAPAVKVVPRPDAPGGIPDVEVFALRVPGVGLLGVAAAGAFFGLRGLLAAAVLGALQHAMMGRGAILCGVPASAIAIPRVCRGRPCHSNSGVLAAVLQVICTCGQVAQQQAHRQQLGSGEVVGVEVCSCSSSSSQMKGSLVVCSSALLAVSPAVYFGARGTNWVPAESVHMSRW